VAKRSHWQHCSFAMLRIRSTPNTRAIRPIALLVIPSDSNKHAWSGMTFNFEGVALASVGLPVAWRRKYKLHCRH
jgi:hypothetical protein